jgi:xanthine dehydrogenase accessory factor
MDRGRVFAFLHKRLIAGEAGVTVISVDGSSMRGVGSHMGVAADGSFEGSLSGGCIENAVVAEALEALKEGTPRFVRFGAGSPYIDIKLPCGGGLDIHFQPLENTDFIGMCVKAIKARKPFTLQLPNGGGAPELLSDLHGFDSVKEGHFFIKHIAVPKLIVLGHGASVVALARLAQQMHLEVEVLSSDPALVDELAADSFAAKHLPSPSDTAPLASDDCSAIVFLFHDHDWETELMAKAMELPHFYLGAMGGKIAHAARIEALRARGSSEEAIAAIRAPIGLFHSSRDPESLALSALSEIIKTYHETDFFGG